MLIDSLITGLANTFSWPNILIPTIATMFAMIVAFLPGIGMASVMAMLLVLTAAWETESVLLLFGALIGGATFMGSITAILFNIPGSAPNAAALLDGYPLSQKGFTKTAISCAAVSSALGSVVGVIVLIVLIPVLQPVIQQLGPLEKLLLGIWGLTTVVAVPSSSKIKAALMGLLGFLLAMVGSDPVQGEMRWTFGFLGMSQGIGTIPTLLGMFTVAEIISWTVKNNEKLADNPEHSKDDSIKAGILSVIKYRWLALRSSIIGTLVGIVPGIGGTVASFVAYGHAVKSAGDTQQFGKGDIRGLIAPEAANDAKDGGSILPAIAFGLPGSEAGVFLVTVMLMHGMVPGSSVLTNQLPLTFTLIIALLFSNLLTSVIGLVAAPRLSRLKLFPLQKLALPLLVFSLILVFQLNGQLIDVYTMVTFAAGGFLLKKFNWPRIPLIIAFVLGEFLERNLALSTRLIEINRIAISEKPIVLTLLLLIAFSIFWMSRSAKPLSKHKFVISDFVITTAIAMIAIAFSTTAYIESYSTISLGISLTLLIICSIALLGNISGKKQLPLSSFSISEMHIHTGTKHCLLLCTFPLFTVLLGYVSSVGMIVYLWIAIESKQMISSRGFIWGTGSNLLSYLLLVNLWNVPIPVSSFSNIF